MIPAVYIGFDTREAAAFAVAKHSARLSTRLPMPIRGIVLDQVRADGLYRRPTESRISTDEPGAWVLWDRISAAPMSTEFAISRFLTPILARQGWALFMDCDVLVRCDLMRLFELADPTKAVQCVQHEHHPAGNRKMVGQVQLDYPRKNWSSVMLFNCDHPANRRLTLDLVNSAPGRDLHAFCWLKDDEIGALPPEWNWLAGISDPALEPKIVHFTDGFPLMPGYEHQPYAEEWRCMMADWAIAGR